MRIMLDTNVLISLFVFKGKKFEDLFIKVCFQHTLVLSSYIIDELYEVVEKKFPGKSEFLNTFLSRIPFEQVHMPEDKPDHNLFIIRDDNDDKVLYSAIIADVDIFITGDKDFIDVVLQKPKILTPTQFLERF
ncbi:MAG: putative toxin-antitoxin system toxin component, PIN family [Anaerolineaceae bacterium]|nr:putative toxin-antitoxin system toxin component, PIN family [Anaerolineaceae bacterium]